MKMALNSSSWEAQLDRRVGLLKFCLDTKNQGLLDAVTAQQFSGNKGLAALVGDDHKPHQGWTFAQILFEAASQRINLLKEAFDVDLNEFSKKAKPDNKEAYDKLVSNLEESTKEECKVEIDGLINEVKRHIRDVPKEDRNATEDLAEVLVDSFVNFCMAQVIVVENLEVALPEHFKRIMNKAFQKNEAASRATKALLKSVTGVTEVPRGPPRSQMPGISPKVDRLCIRKTENGWEISEIE